MSSRHVNIVMKLKHYCFQPIVKSTKQSRNKYSFLSVFVHVATHTHHIIQLPAIIFKDVPVQGKIVVNHYATVLLCVAFHFIWFTSLFTSIAR